MIARLARLRVFLGFVFSVVVWWRAHPTAGTLLVGAAVASVGEAIRIWAAGHLNKSREVTSSGPYRWSAHPLYVGSTVMGGGLAIASGSLLVAMLIAAYLATTLTAAVKSEEAFLRRTFGDRYDTYRQGDTSGDRARDDASSRRPFSMKQAIANREYRALIGLLMAVLLLALKATYN